MTSDIAVRTGADLEAQLEQHRSMLTGYCYRMLGSAFEAEDAVQETMVRAWRGIHRFEGRAALGSWLYRIATNVCFDMLKGRERRARPMDLGPAWSPRSSSPGAPLGEEAWIEPIPDARVLPADSDPAELAVARDSVRLAFVAALAYLPPRQRAVLILRDVLRWKAAEVADLLDTSVPSVNSALQRARTTLDAHDVGAADSSPPMDEADRGLLARYVDAFERFDVEALVALLREDVALTMPPFPLWLRGPADIAEWLRGPGAGCHGSRLVPTAANGVAAFGQYRRSETGGHEAFALQVIETSGGRIVGLHHYLDTERIFPLFGLPVRLDP